MSDDLRIRRASRGQAASESTLGPGLGLGLGGGWFLVFSSWQPFPSWARWVFDGAGFVLVLLGLILCSVALGNILTKRRRRDY